MKNDILQDVFNNIDDKLIFDADRENHYNTIHFTKWIAIIVAINVLFSASVITIFAVLGKNDVQTSLSDEEILLNKIMEANIYSNIFKKVTSFTAVDDRTERGEIGTYLYIEQDVKYSEEENLTLVTSDNISLLEWDSDLYMLPISNSNTNNRLDSSLFFKEFKPYIDYKFEISKFDFHNGSMEIILTYYYDTPHQYQRNISFTYDVESLLIKKYCVTEILNDCTWIKTNYSLFYNIEPKESAQEGISTIRNYVKAYENGDVCTINYIKTNGDIFHKHTYVKGAKILGYYQRSSHSYWPEFVATDNCNIEAIYLESNIPTVHVLFSLELENSVMLPNGEKLR